MCIYMYTHTYISLSLYIYIYIYTCIHTKKDARGREITSLILKCLLQNMHTDIFMVRMISTMPCNRS